MYLLDTNVLSDSLRNKHYPVLKNWLAQQTYKDLFISSISLAEIAYGVYKLPEGNRKVKLIEDLQRLQMRFAERILVMDIAVSLAYGEHQAVQVNKGLNDDPFDSMLIATAKVHDLVVATRNVKHYQNRGVAVINPYV